MNMIVAAAFSATVVLSAARNILSKPISVCEFGTKSFFRMQRLIFFGGSAFLAIPTFKSFVGISPETLIYAIVYALLLITAQWNYTAAMGEISTSVCVTVYSCGFIFPAVSGALFWNEKFSVFKFFGIVLAVLAIFVSNYGEKTLKSAKTSNIGFFRLFSATVASGGLGIMQKVQQSSSAADEKSVFVLSAFLFAGIVSLIFEKTVPFGAESSTLKKERICAAAVGICFACCNLLNTYLAGKLDSAFFFPVQNTAVIIASTAICAMVFSEKLSVKEIVVIILGICAAALNR